MLTYLLSIAHAEHLEATACLAGVTGRVTYSPRSADKVLVTLPGSVVSEFRALPSTCCGHIDSTDRLWIGGTDYMASRG